MQEKVVIRSSLRDNLPIVSLLSIIFTLVIVVVFIKADELRSPGGWHIFIPLSFYPLFLYWITSFRVTFIHDQLMYSTLFSKKCVDFKDIKYISFQKNLNLKAPLFTLYVDAGPKSFAIALRPFISRGMVKIAKELVKSLDPEKLDPDVSHWAKKEYYGHVLTLTQKDWSQVFIGLAVILILTSIARVLIH